ncbi:hypothetical protein DMB37_36105 [Nocardia sp. CS682]|nr:hypothetical protein DMB37_36105 [Nocardia sp. CS682]
MIVSTALLAGTAAVVVSGPAQAGPTAEERELQLVETIFNVYLCNKVRLEEGGPKELEPHSETWYQEWEKIEAEAPFEIKGGGNPARGAREELFREPGGTFNEETREEMCTRTEDYAETLAKIMKEVKGKIKSGYTTESELAKFFDAKARKYCVITEKDREKNKRNIETGELLSDGEEQPSSICSQL